MSAKHALSLTVVLLFVLVSCGQPATETEPETSPAETTMETGPDSTVVDAGHYTAEFENDRVRLVRISYGPGEESVMHYHPEAVGVYLTDANVEMTFPDGETSTLQNEAGQHAFYPAGQHLPKNVGDQPLELVLIELKSGATGATIPDGEDATAVDPGHYTVEFENDRVRILRIAYEPGDESVMHHHPDNVAVFLTDHHAQMTAADGSTAESIAVAGATMFGSAEKHQPKNIADGAMELVLVELK